MDIDPVMSLPLCNIHVGENEEQIDLLRFYGFKKNFKTQLYFLCCVLYISVNENLHKLPLKTRV